MLLGYGLAMVVSLSLAAAFDVAPVEGAGSRSVEWITIGPDAETGSKAGRVAN
jgi:hypothetical protein